MSGQMMPAHGAFCWNELATTDLDGAVSFYKELLGWEIKHGGAPGGGVRYDEIAVGGRNVGGMMQMGPEFGSIPSHWMAYVSVEDVDASAAKVTELGGKVCVPPTDIPNVGRFSVINDPTGATIALITLKGASE